VLVVVKVLVIVLVAALGCARTIVPDDDGTPTAVRVQAKPLPPAEVTLAFRPEVFRRGEEVDLQLTLTTAVALSRVSATLRLPPQIRSGGEATVWEGPLTPGTPRTLTFRVRIAAADRFDLGASVEILEGPYAGQVAGTIVHVDATGPEIRSSLHPIEN
jgi:hypothetical protein